IHDEGDKERAQADARLKYEDELDKARTEHELKILELRKRQIDEARAEAGKFYDALRGGSGGVQKFFTSQLDTLGRQVTSNALGGVFQRINKSLGVVDHDALHGIFNGTVLDKASSDPATTTAKETKRTADAVEALRKEIRAAWGSATAGTGIPGIDDLPISD